MFVEEEGVEGELRRGAKEAWGGLSTLKRQKRLKKLKRQKKLKKLKKKKLRKLCHNTMRCSNLDIAASSSNKQLVQPQSLKQKTQRKQKQRKR